MTSQSDLETIAIHILSNISQSKDNQTMKFGQSKEYNMKNIFLKIWRKWDIERVIPDLFSFFRKALSGKSKWSAA